MKISAPRSLSKKGVVRTLRLCDEEIEHDSLPEPDGPDQREIAEIAAVQN
jgi:hypothetical protein